MFLAVAACSCLLRHMVSCVMAEWNSDNAITAASALSEDVSAVKKLSVAIILLACNSTSFPQHPAERLNRSTSEINVHVNRLETRNSQKEMSGRRAATFPTGVNRKKVSHLESAWEVSVNFVFIQIGLVVTFRALTSYLGRGTRGEKSREYSKLFYWYLFDPSTLAWIVLRFDLQNFQN